MPRRLLALLALGALALGLLSACRVQTAESTIFAMDTVMSLTVYGAKGDQALEEASELIYTLQDALSATDENSPIYALNHAGGAWTPVEGEVLDLLEGSKELCALTGGALDITAYPAVQAWGFISKDYRVPGEEELEELAGRIDYAALELDLKGSRARLPEGMEVELGAVAKGYTGDRLARLMAELGVDSAIFSLGGNVQAVGCKPDGSPWRVAVQDPGGQGNLAVVEVTDKAVVPSGGYQRYFEQDGVLFYRRFGLNICIPIKIIVLHFQSRLRFQTGDAHLGGIHVIIESTLLHQLLMCTGLNDVSAIHHHDDIGIANGTKPVRNDKCCSSTHQFCHYVLNVHFRPGINI